MQNLETIVARMESSRLPLNDLLVSYEEGTKLVKICTEHLSAAEQRIEIITRSSQGEPGVAVLTSRPAGAAGNPPEIQRKSARPAPVKSPTSSQPTNDEVSLF